MKRAGKSVLILLSVLAALIVTVMALASGRYIETDTGEPDTVRIVGPVMSRRFSDGELDFRSFILLIPDFSGSGPLGFFRMRIVTPFSDVYPFRSSELLYVDLMSRRVVLSSLAYDEGVVETVYRRG